ncbi:hypothetical protein, partial [Helicobacter ganmani]|uniref:hypothetical protein n=1 Tax=Helicobacter ganmani TaxID=60246 RepID=UPI003A8A318A
MYCTSNTMFNPHSAKERIKNHLAYKLGLALIEYDKQRQGISQENFNSKESQNNKTNSPFSFKPQETLNHSIPVRGGGHSNPYLDSFTPLAFLNLLLSLYKLKQTHKQQQQFYKQTIQVFPSLKYPPLQSCKDYPESLSYKYHLAYLLGEALSKADKIWYKGGYFTLNKKIKEAKHIYKLHQEYKAKLQELHLSYCFIPKEFLLDSLSFLKAIETLMHKLKSQENNSFKIESFFFKLFSQIPFSTQTPFLLKHKEEILQWLNSKEFKEQYIKTNHPYPPLLNPERLNAKRESKECNVESQRENRDSIQPYPNLSYESIPAELAWDLNLPLPRGYEMIYLFGHGAGVAKVNEVFSAIGLRIISLFIKGSANNRYILAYNFLLHSNGFNVVSLSDLEYQTSNYLKFFSLIDKKVSFMCQTRDPMELLRHCLARAGRWTHGLAITKEFDKTFDFEDVIKPLEHLKYNYNLEGLKKYAYSNLFSFHIHLKELQKNISKIAFLDIKELNSDEAI